MMGYVQALQEQLAPLHCIHEERLDQAVEEVVAALAERCRAEQQKLAEQQKMWALRKPSLDAQIAALRGRIEMLEGEIDEIVMVRIHLGGACL